MSDILVFEIINLLEGQTDKLITLPWFLKRLSEVEERSAAQVAALKERFELTTLYKCLRELTGEGIFLPNFHAFVEACLRVADEQDAVLLSELLRSHLAEAVCEPLLNHLGGLELLVLDSELEERLLDGLKSGNVSVLGPISDSIGKALGANPGCRVLCVHFEHRRQIRDFAERRWPGLAVLSWTDIPPHTPVQVLETVHCGWIFGSRPVPSGSYIASPTGFSG